MPSTTAAPIAPPGSRLRPVARWLAHPPRFLPPLAVQCLKVALACGLAWWAGPALGMPRPFNAVLAVIILMQGHAYGSLLNALEFLLGVAAGLVLGIGAHTLLGLSPLVLAALMLVCLLPGGWLRVSRQGFNNQIAISALLVLASGSADSVSRLWETALGGAIGVVVAALLWPPDPVRELRRDCRELRTRIGSDVMGSLEAAGRPGDPGEAEAIRRRVREHSERADAAVAALGPAEDALRWSPWHAGRLHDLSHLEDRVRLISHLYRTVRALARQSAKTRRPGGEDDARWDAARPHLRSAGSRLAEAIDRRLRGHEGLEASAPARQAVGRFAMTVPPEHSAAALVAAMDDLLSDVETWRPGKQVDPDRQLPIRILRRLGWRAPAGSPTADGDLEFADDLRRARLLGLAGVLTGRPRTAPPLTDVLRSAGVRSLVDRGVRAIPLERVRGSRARSRAFDRSFRPRSRRLRSRWVRVYTEMEEAGSPPPIDVYQVGDGYFVKHGHHRVSVARRLGWDRIPARVVEVRTRAPLGSDLTAGELLRAGEYATFLERTELDRTRPEARLACSHLGRYDVVYDHILGHRYFLGVERGHAVSVPDAAASWFDSVYRPLMDVARSQALPARLPGWTDADLYLALSRLWLELEGGGRPAGPEVAAEALLADPAGGAPGRRRRSRRRWRALGVVRRLVPAQPRTAGA